MYRISNRIVIGGGSSLEQAAPSSLQVVLPSQRILEGNGHGFPYLFSPLIVATFCQRQQFHSIHSVKRTETPRGAGGRIRPDECLRPTKVKRQAIFALDRALATNVQKGLGTGRHRELRLLD